MPPRRRNASPARPRSTTTETPPTTTTTTTTPTTEPTPSTEDALATKDPLPPKVAAPASGRAQRWILLGALSTIALGLLYTYVEPVGKICYELLGNTIVCTTIPVAYTRMVAGSERLAIRAAHALALASFSFWIFTHGGVTPGWDAFYAVGCAHVGSLLLADHRAAAVLWSAAAALFTLSQTMDGTHAAPRRAAVASCVLAGAALVLGALPRPLPTLNGRRAALLVGALAVGGGAAPTLASHFLPVEEFAAVYALAARLADARELESRAAQLALVTVHAQLPLGYAGRSILRAAQARKNRLLEVGHGRLSALDFARGVGEFITMHAAPYFAQRCSLEILNHLAHIEFTDWVEGSLRVDAALADGGALAAAAASNLTIDGHSSALRQVVDTTFNIIERRLFALPKLALFPAVVAKHPRTALLVLPFAFGVDALKAKLVARLTERVEALRREKKKVLAVRTRVEAHDAQHAGLIAAARAAPFTRGRWRELTGQVNGLSRQLDTLGSLRNWIRWLYWQDVFHPMIECSVAYLLQVGDISVVDIWVYSRVVEDFMESMLMRSRNEAELAQLTSDTKRLDGLADLLDERRARGEAMVGRLKCAQGAAAEAELRLTVSFTRGAASVRVEGLALRAPAVYAIVGPNGSGKSSLFSILGACGGDGSGSSGGGGGASGHVPIDIELAEGAPAEVVVPRGELVAVSQRQYCPLHTRPIEWLVHALPAAEQPGGAADEAALAARAAERAVALRFGGKADELHETLLREHDDYCGTLSGGQRAKLDLIAQVFLRAACPAVVLLDEAFAPLDPASKALVMRQLRESCPASLVLVIYHGDETGDDEEAEGAGAAAETGGDTVAAEGAAAAAAVGGGGNSTTAISEVCAVGDGFFDGVVRFGDDGNVTVAAMC